MFPGHGRFAVQQWVYVASFLAALKDSTIVGGSIGALAGGRIHRLGGPGGRAEAWTVEPGVFWSLSAGRRWLGQRPAIPYLLLVGTVSGLSTRTRAQATGVTTPLHAFDARADFSVGWTLGEAFSPYLAVRAFGGPALWQLAGSRVVGTDLYHVSLAAGFNLSLADRVGLYFDGAFLGLRSLGGGVSVRF